MADNSNLHYAKRAKNDEFYTRLTDIENELKNYKGKFKGKVVFCNCDDPVFFKNGKMDSEKTSKFIVHFTLLFEHYGLKKLICLGYKKGQKATAYVYHGDLNRNGFDDECEWEKIQLAGDGDFRSPESLAFLKEANVVVTNPPFSLFREYVSTMEEYGKKYLLIGNMNAITYKEIFPLIKENKLWLGINPVKAFSTPQGTMQKFGNILWFTNIDHAKRHEQLLKDNPLLKDSTTQYKGNENKYPKYDNYDAIEVSKVVDLPADYMGVMGVPITFLTRYNPEEFEILGADEAEGTGFSNGLWITILTDKKQCVIAGGKIYKRIFIRRK